jgi:hypothetical protein
MKYTYNIECPLGDKWVAFIKMQTRTYCDGYLDALEGQFPRNNLRMVRSDGKIVREVKAFDDVSVGMIAGWPTAEQYEHAAERALEKAKRIREKRL